jgi:signal transduction histidine kinase
VFDEVNSIELDAAQATLLHQMEELRRRLLPRFLYVMAVAFLVWLLWSSWKSENLSLVELAWTVLGVMALISARLASTHCRLATWVLLSGVIAGLALLLRDHPGPVIVAAGVLVIVVASSLLSLFEATLAGALAYAATLGLWLRMAPEAVTAAEAQAWAAFYLLVLVATQIGQSPMREATHLALEGWSQLRAALVEARSRRGELHRVARALEEATYRIERMNNELTLAWHQAEVARANKTRFAATVSHELRGPLNLVLGFARLMALSPERYGAPLPRTYRADIDTIYASSQHLVALLDDVLDLSQAEVERMPLIKEWVDLGQVLSEAKSVVSPLAERKGLVLRSAQVGTDFLVLADRVRLRQVMLNLLTNAVRFTERGEVAIHVQRQPEQVTVSVCDTGRGIRSDDLPRLFQEFSQLHLDAQPGEGSGLGLAISKHLVQLHGGHIWAESEEGVGTTISFTLPLGKRPSEALHSVRASTHELPQQHRLVLVVHDNPAVARLLARHLQGYQIVGAPNLESLAALVRDHLPRAVLVEASAASQAKRTLHHIGLGVPIIGCSLPRFGELDVPGKSNGGEAYRYLIKPVTQEMLGATLHEVTPSGTELIVLVVDDDPDAVRLLEIMLKGGMLPRRVLKAYDGQQALDIMKETVPDLVLLDLVMPHMNGETTLAQMRADPRLRDVPVVIISARDAAGDMATIGGYMEVHAPQPSGASQGVRRLQAILETLTPTYLAEEAAS